MSTIGSLLALADPGITPYNQQELTENRIRSGNITNQTGLLELAELRRQQEAAALARQYLQANPQAVLGAAGDRPLSTLGALGPAAAPPGPMTQQTVVPGQPQPPPQVVPGGQDLSRFATSEAPGGAQQSTLATLAPQPQANPLMELMRQNPDAAMQIIGQQQKLAETRLGYRAKIFDYMASAVQGASDQASWDQARQEVARVDPQAAAALPQAYTAAARDQLVQQALSAKDALTLQVQNVQAQAALTRARKEGRSTEVDNHLRAMGVQPGQETPAQMREALTAIQQGKVAVSAAQGAEQAQQRALGESGRERLAAYDKAGLTAETTHGTLDQIEALLTSPEGIYGNSPEARLAMARYNAGLNPSDQRARNTAQLRNLGSQLQLAHGSLGTGVSVYDAQVYAKAAGDFQNAQNVEQMRQYIGQMRPVLDQAMTRANAARTQWEKTGQLPEFGRGRQARGTQGGATRGGPPAATGGTVSLETLGQYADKHKIPLGQAIKQAYDKGLEIE